ncbi:30332_t:CDS:2, partial [Gigaspora margarita]
IVASGNRKIDYAIQSMQNHPVFSITIIEYSEFSNIETLGRDGFSVVFKANYEDNVVALKVVEGSKNMPSNFLNELKCHQSCRDSSGFLKLYGVSIEPSTKDYILVMKFMAIMDLRRNLAQTKSFKTIVYILFNIAKDLMSIHNNGLIHRDLHCGNILQNENDESYISDLDLIRMIALQGLRPSIPDDLPRFYQNLMVRCWDQNPLLRPNTEEILYQLWDWHINVTIQKEITKYDQIRCKKEIKENIQYNTELYT